MVNSFRPTLPLVLTTVTGIDKAGEDMVTVDHKLSMSLQFTRMVGFNFESFLTRLVGLFGVRQFQRKNILGFIVFPGE